MNLSGFNFILGIRNGFSKQLIGKILEKREKFNANKFYSTIDSFVKILMGFEKVFFGFWRWDSIFLYFETISR